MIPVSSTLSEFHPTDRLNESARATPAFREELRRIPNGRNAANVALVWIQTVGIIVAAVWIDNWAVSIAARSAHGSRAARAVRGADARGRAPPPVPQQEDQRLRRPLAARLPVVHAYRFVPPRAHGPSPRRVRTLRARHPALLAGTPSRRPRCAASSCAMRPARPDGSSSRGCSERSTRRSPAIRFQRARSSARSSVFIAIGVALGHPSGSTSSSGSRRTSPCGRRDQSLAVDRRARRDAALEGPSAHHAHGPPALVRPLLLVPYHIGWHLAHHVDAGVPMANLPKLHRELRKSGYVTDSLEYRSYPALWRRLSSGTTSNAASTA